MLDAKDWHISKEQKLNFMVFWLSDLETYTNRCQFDDFNDLKSPETQIQICDSPNNAFFPGWGL